jgi:hypothetical protein
VKARKTSPTLRVTIPALTLLLGTGLLVAGGPQNPIEQDFTRPWQIAEGEATDEIPTPVTSADCVFLNDPQAFTEDRERGYAVRTSAMNRIVRWTVSINEQSSGGGGDPTQIPRRNFIDDEIFTRLASANIQSAPLASDEEFLRRVTLDLTGRIPSAMDVTNFLDNSSSIKRDNEIDALIASPEFTDKWTLFFGDLFQNNVNSTHVSRGIQGRDAFYLYLRDSIAQNKPYDVMAREMITATGDPWLVGQANWPVGNTISMGPAQDTYDGAAVDLSSMFMGISVVDCLLCHDGARHLEQVNLWGATETRQNMWGLAAYFSRTVMTRPAQGAMSGIVVSDNTTTTVDYRLNTTNGNRNPRQPIGGVNSIAPRYPFSNAGSGVNNGEAYRQAIARQITEDLQFSRAAVNYIWEKMMGEAFVSPSNAFDLSRLDPNNPPPAPWTLQPTNPQLLDRLARDFQSNGYNIRRLIGLIAKSSAYQLSSSYPGTWQPSYVPYYARKFVRRLDSEEIHDAVVKATALTQPYTFAAPSVLQPTAWAGQFPDTQEPRSNGAVAQFLNVFGRGDRDLNTRRYDGSVLQGLTMLNNTFVTNRSRNSGTTPTSVTTLLQQTSDPETIIRKLFLNTLSRRATQAEVDAVMPSFQELGNAVAAEDLQWALLNRLQFLFNY